MWSNTNTLQAFHGSPPTTGLRWWPPCIICIKQ
jgi:hypothetical protein